MKQGAQLCFVFVLLLWASAAAKHNHDHEKPSQEEVNAVPISERMAHIVVLMLENRAFDHMCGFLKKWNPAIDGLNGNETCPFDPKDLSQGSAQVSNDSSFITNPDPNHSLPSTTDQVFGYGPQVNPAPMDGFVYNYFKNGDTEAKGANIMKCFDPNTVPALSTLANEYAIFDRWYASLPGPTQPNRMYWLSATSYGATSNVPSELALGYPQTTLMDNLYSAGYSWRDYWSDFPSVLFLYNLRDPIYIENYRLMSEFYSDAAAGDLPTYSFLEPRWFDFFDYGASDEHPPHDVSLGEYLIADVYNALRNGPLWNSTLFIITYDEHGGLYDHVPTPQTNVPAPDDVQPLSDEPPFNFTRLGVRVPTIMVSPWINRHTVVHEPASSHYEHSSFAATVKKVFGLPNFLTKRDAWAATFEDVLASRATPRTDCPTSVPTPPSHGSVSFEKFQKLEREGVTLESIKVQEQTSQPSEAPLTELHQNVISIASGLADTETVNGVLEVLEADDLKTEHQGALYVQRMMRQFQERQKRELRRRRRAEKKKQKEQQALSS